MFTCIFKWNMLELFGQNIMIIILTNKIVKNKRKQNLRI